MALENKTIPPNIKFTTPNPKSERALPSKFNLHELTPARPVKFEEYKLVVPVKPMPWPEDRASRISVNSFGIGGSNAHVSTYQLFRFCEVELISEER